MMKYLKIFVFFLGFSINVYAQDTLWTKTYGGSRDDFGYSVKKCSDGGFIIAEKKYSYGVDFDVYLIRNLLLNLSLQMEVRIL